MALIKNSNYDVLDTNETENLILYTIYKLGESDYLELCNVLYVLDALLTKEEGKRLPFLRGSVSNERGVILRGLADAIECLYIEKKIQSKANSEVYKLSSDVEKNLEKIEEEVMRKISSKTIEPYTRMLEKLSSIRDSKLRLEKSVEYAFKYLTKD